MFHRIPMRSPLKPFTDPLQVARRLSSYPIQGRLKPSISFAATPRILIRQNRLFHATARRQGGPLIPLLATILKTSSSLGLIQTTGRVILTFVPVFLFKSCRAKVLFKRFEGDPAFELKREQWRSRQRLLSRIAKTLLAVPLLLVVATVLASMERTPLTGRLRFILLSPDEETVIANQLAGPGWYQAVGDILAKEEAGAPVILPVTDWRYAWVQDTLRKLERAIPSLSQERHLEPSWLDQPTDVPFPPPAKYPLYPRPRVTESLRSFCDRICAHKIHKGPHSIPGPPYSLLIVEKPDALNAFSYGFGPDGGGGIVVYTGFLDHVLSKSSSTSTPPLPTKPPAEKSWFSMLFSGLRWFSPPEEARNPKPTTEQTSELAILLAHELAHLVLSHHLESMSSSAIVIPTLVSIMTDVVRVIAFPITMLFGPFVNDAVAKVSTAGGRELAEMSLACSNTTQEFEADVVSTRLLAHAGFDARLAVQFWESRENTAKTAECSPNLAEKGEEDSILMRRITGEYHPDSANRVQCLKNEIARWQTERERAFAQRQSQN